MITVSTLLWDANAKSEPFSRSYNEEWVEKLYRGFARNLTQPFRFLLFTDRFRNYSTIRIEQQIVQDLGKNGYSDCIKPFAAGVPMILVGLDTIITGNIDHLAEYCLKTKPTNPLGMPRDPYFLERACNGVVLIPSGKRKIFTQHRGENDMEWLRLWPHQFLDDVFPGQVISWKGSKCQDNGIGDARIVYFHGSPKMHQLLLAKNPIIEEHWK